ncbi:MAG: 4Fe-4S dicluster domain-containing protein [Desulfovibrionales bacterium]|nr:4Fe-4S dicluster domain-containing protein [Desulfovibrionales bacterium]
MSLIDSVREAGVIGAGGAGFPTHVKLSAQAEYILLNGAECEPLLRVDQQLMAQYPDEIIKGFAAAGKAVDAQHAYLCIKAKHAAVIGILEERIAALGVAPFVEVKQLDDVYPAGDEQILVYTVTGRCVPEGGIPLNVGCVVINSETALNVYNAEHGIPVTEKYITVAGDIPNRVTVKVPVGTPVMDVLKQSGLESFDGYTVIGGGPMMGPVLKELSGYVTKKDKGFVILKDDHSLIRKKTTDMSRARRINLAACAQCRMCTDLCPRYLIGHNVAPHKSMRILNYNLGDAGDKTHAQLCCQCNLCEYFSCPAGLHPKLANDALRQQLMEEGVRFQPTGEEPTARENREYRQVSSKRLTMRIGLTDFDKPAPLQEGACTPSTVRIALNAHVGAPSVPVVAVNERVEAGQCIAAIKDGALGATAHASLAGTVVAVENGYIEIERG